MLLFAPVDSFNYLLHLLRCKMLGSNRMARHHYQLLWLFCMLQLVFAVVSPGAVLPNLVAGAIAEAGAQQAGDLMQVGSCSKLPERGLHCSCIPASADFLSCTGD